MNKFQIQGILQKSPSLKDKLYAWGFMFTDADIDESDYPFYGSWQSIHLKCYHLLVASQQKCFVKENKGDYYILVGHAYNPFTLCADENELLSELSKNCFAQKEFWAEVNQLTGIFTLICIVNGKVHLIGDATCMQTVFYTVNQSHIYIASHTNLFGDLLDLKWSSYIRELSAYKFFKLLGNALPGDLTPYEEVKRLVPNHFVSFDSSGNTVCQRFFAPKNHQLSVSMVADKVSDILSKNLMLISEKWDNAAISMTGGCDSKTTLACTVGRYGFFSYFSYVSSQAERVDADAAHEICSALELEHRIYPISENDFDFVDIESIRALVKWNAGGILDNNKNDVRKRAFFNSQRDFEIEVKSWASEIGRAYYSKRFNGRKNFGTKPTARKCTTMYKFFLNNRKLVKKTDRVFEEYLKKYFEQASENPVDWQEQFFWEYRVASWNGLVITGEHRFSFDITIPYNNRLLLELLLSVPIEERIMDSVYTEIRKKMNPAIDKTGIAVTNLLHTKNREIVEGIYYSIHSKVPF